ncbi:DeoR/GlpR family DNA-binding transcription regulator [Tessaracoccus sp. OS52]|uniref:DeoR/GlpR family DNA-binding transcription regulator n=1 Tax=Tessaracoccus sp. OS52 TaxID=2886691 RepID=UPI001D12D083|nr:DeoR/GlpR family DNA-binding transcription regulator [Tessaracoccus sp. OS52]MCC2594494.1 DeoR/GlpR family DNA-binding transcription regulator [Tessaracoccus sp. OS52]
MLAEARRQLILQELQSNGGVETEAIAQRFEVSVETIRRDFVELERRSLAQRVYGGAVAVGACTEPSHVERERVAAAEKRQIAALVASRIPDEATVFLDDGTTVEAVAAALHQTFRGTVVTASLRVATALAKLPACNIILTGGNLRKSDLSLEGSAPASFLEGVYPDVGLISVGAIDPTAGVTLFERDELQLKKIVLANAVTSVVVADSGKFGKVAPFKLCDVATPSCIATDGGLTAKSVKALKDRGAHILQA